MTGQPDLFENTALLAWLPGETLFSLVSRHHYFWGYRLASQTCQRFFGHSRSGSQHDLPSRLSEFAARTGCHYGGAEEVARQRTILSYYGSFMDSNELRHFLTSMAGDSVAHLKLRLGILTSRFRSHHPLKACEACMASDRQVHGWAYWHIEHQYPGVWTCPIHKTLLLESSLKATGVERFLWHLPNARDVQRTSIVEASGESPKSFSGLTELITALVKHGHERPMALADLHVHYRAELGKRGFLTSGGNIRMPAIAQSYLDHVRNFRAVWEFEALPATYNEAVTQLGRLLRPPRGGTHPLRHLVLIHWLFGSADSFLSSLTETRTTRDLSTASIGQLVPPPQPSIEDPRRARVIEMISQKCSFRKAAAAVGIDVQTAMTWASQAGLSGSRRPKILAGSVREQAIVQLTAGEDKVVVASAAGVSVVTITKLLFSEVGFPLAFPHGARVLDIGCGSGRDASRLHAKGYDAFGVEPSAGLRAAAMANHPELLGKIADAMLPNVGLPFGGRFDAVLCSAVLMHVPDSQLFDAALSIRALLKQHGRLLISLPLSRGDSHVDQRDADGRLFSPYTPEEITLLFERLGFQAIGRWDTGDALARAGTSWYTLLFELRNSGVQRPIDQIETILNRDKKEATYKLALFRALAEISTQESRLAVWMTHGEVGIPIQRVAELWLQYFWPIFASDKVIPQSQAEGADGKAVKFRASMTELIGNFQNQGEHGGLSSWHLAWSSNRLEPQLQRQLSAVLKLIVSTIKDGPVTYSGGALETGPVFRYDAAQRLIVMQADLWRELSLLGHWISDAVILRWAALTQKFSYRQGITAGDVLPLLLARPQPQRATALARQAYQAAGVSQCTWSGKPLRADFAVDHVMPFSLWGNNDLWNLMPADPKVNGNKSDKLPTTELLLTKQQTVQENWEHLRSELTEPFDLQARHLLGKPLAKGDGWKWELFARLREAVEVTAIQRGVIRWAPVETVTRGT